MGVESRSVVQNVARITKRWLSWYQIELQRDFERELISGAAAIGLKEIPDGLSRQGDPVEVQVGLVTLHLPPHICSMLTAMDKDEFLRDALA